MPTRKAQYFESEILAPSDYTMRLYSLPVRYVPLMLSALETRKGRSFWSSEDDFIRGYNVLSEIQIMLLNPALTTQEIVNAIDRLYTLQAQAMNGTQHNAELQPDGTYIYSPPLSQSAPTLQDGIGLSPGIRRQLLNAQGTVNDGWFDGPARSATLADITQAARVNGTQDEGVISDAIEEILGAGGNVGAIGTVLSNIFGTASDIATDGGLAAISIASSLANSVIAGAQGAQLDSIIQGLQLLTDRLTLLTGTAQPAGFDGDGILQYLTNVLGDGFEEGQPLPEDRMQPALLRASQRLGNISVQSNTIAETTGTNLPIIATRLSQLLGIEAVGDPVVANSLLVLAECICQQTSQINEKTPSLPPPGDVFPSPNELNVCDYTLVTTYRMRYNIDKQEYRIFSAQSEATELGFDLTTTTNYTVGTEEAEAILTVLPEGESAKPLCFITSPPVDTTSVSNSLWELRATPINGSAPGDVGRPSIGNVSLFSTGSGTMYERTPNSPSTGLSYKIGYYPIGIPTQQGQPLPDIVLYVYVAIAS